MKLSDGTTLGGYWKATFNRDTTYGLLEKRAGYGDDMNPSDPPDCKDLPGGSDCAARSAFNSLPKRQPYIPFYATSNAVAAGTLIFAGIPFSMPSCAFGAFPYTYQQLKDLTPMPRPIDYVPKVNF